MVNNVWNVWVSTNLVNFCFTGKCTIYDSNLHKFDSISKEIIILIALLFPINQSILL